MRGLVNMGGEGLEEVVSDLADPALQTIYNGKTLGENYRALNMRDLRHDAEVGMLLGGLGGAVDIAQAERTGLSTPYSDMLREKQLTLPYSNVINTAAATENQTVNHPNRIRYQELERKFLDGSIEPQEGVELWRLENVWGKFDAQKRFGEQESDWLISMERKARALLSGNKAVAFSSLPDKMKVEFKERLSSADPDVESVLRMICDSAKYRLGTDQRSFYTSVIEKNGTIIDEDTITIGINAPPSTIAHELFHKLDKGRTISAELSDSLIQDFIALNVQSGGDIKEYLSTKYKNAFVRNLDNDLVVKPEFRGIGDILNGLSGGQVAYGYGHSKSYWSKRGSLEAEAWAQFGRVYYDNNTDVIRMFEEIFPNLSKRAKEKLKEIM